MEKSGTYNPSSVDSYESYFNPFIISCENLEHSYAIRKNICYNFQFLDYLHNHISPDMHAVVYKHFIKTFIINSIGIIEAIFYCILKSNKLISVDYWELVQKVKSNKFKTKTGAELKIENFIYKKTDNPSDKSLSFENMLAKIERKKLLGDNHKIYEKLNFLRKLRNKIHIHSIETYLDTDWNNFSKENLILIRKVLYYIVTLDLINRDSQSTNIFDFLKESQ